MSRRYQSSFERIGGSENNPDIIYYNASIVNNTTDDVAGTNLGSDPQIRFVETREKAIIDDASQYQFSIIRFLVNGANKDLPLFIPQIQSATDQTNVNLTEYGFGFTFEGLNTSTATQINEPGALEYVIWVPEVQNQVLAPPPGPTSAVGYAGAWSNTTQYTNGQIVAYNGTASQFWIAQGNPAIGEVPGAIFPYILVGTGIWVPTSSELGQPQDLTSRYYWCSTYSYWLILVQNGLNAANLALYDSSADLQTEYATYNDFLADYPVPIISYEPTTNLFSIAYPPDFNLIGVGYTSTGYTLSRRRLFMNINAYGLFSNFPAQFYNNNSTTTWTNPASPPGALPTGYAWEQLVYPIGTSTNVVATSGTYANWLRMTQDYESNSTLWSPCDSIVFTTTQLPTQREAVAPPNTVGSKNIGNSQPTAPSAFQPVLTDIALDLSADTSGYRKMIYYSPVAEYRMSDFNTSGEIRTIDIQVWWKNRLDNQLYPLNMFNLSSVSFKLMFRKKRLSDKVTGSY
jgi:hypothetical protein